MVFGFQLHFIQKSTLAENFWQCLEQNEIQPVFQENFLYFFLKWRNYMFEKYLRTIFGVSSSESVAFYKNKLAKYIFLGFTFFFFFFKPTLKEGC